MTVTAPIAPTARGTLPHIRELDGVRGIAALMVFCHHLLYTDLHRQYWGLGVRLVGKVCSAGDRGVDLFFVLSGFLITSILLKDQQSPSYYQDFYWKRALRILPLYIVCLLYVGLFIPGSGKEILLAALFLSNFGHMLHIGDIGPFWTLAIEEQFYILWPTVVRRRSQNQLAKWAMAVALGALILRTIFAFTGHFNYRFTFLRCDGLAAGALLAIWYQRRRDTPWQRRREAKFMAIGMALGLICLLLRLTTDQSLHGLAFNDDFYQTGTTLIASSAIAFIIANTGSSFLAFLRSRALLFFGLISYAMYMTHLYVLQAYINVRGPLPMGDVAELWTRFIIVLCATIVLCVLSRYLIELPAMSLRRYVLKRPAPPAEIEEPLLGQLEPAAMHEGDEVVATRYSGSGPGPSR